MILRINYQKSALPSEDDCQTVYQDGFPYTLDIPFAFVEMRSLFYLIRTAKPTAIVIYIESNVYTHGLALALFKDAGVPVRILVRLREGEYVDLNGFLEQNGSDVLRESTKEVIAL